MERDLDENPIGQGGRYDTTGSIATNVADGFTMVAVGDLIGGHPGFEAVVEILRNAETFGNMETPSSSTSGRSREVRRPSMVVHITSAFRRSDLI